MAELTLHFEAGAGTDIDAAAAALEEQLKTVSGVDAAQTTPQRFQAIGPAEIISALTLATEIAQNSAMFLKAIDAVIEAWKKVKLHFPKLHAPKIEVGLDQVPLDELTDAHRAELAAQ